MNPALLQSPSVRVALPIIVTIIVAAMVNSKSFDTMNRRLDDLRSDITNRLDSIDARLGRIKTMVSDHGAKIATLEERTSPLRGR